MNANQCYAGSCGSPMGDLWLVANSEGALMEVNFRESRKGTIDEAALELRYKKQGFELLWDEAKLQDARSALTEYFAGKRRSFDLPLAPLGTPFQRRVWDQLLKIPYGQTCSYGALAADIGQPKASRAVGLANGKNPIAIVIPCHRVIGSDGSLTGYAGGVDKKESLLRLEGCLLF